MSLPRLGLADGLVAPQLLRLDSARTLETSAARAAERKERIQRHEAQAVVAEIAGVDDDGVGDGSDSDSPASRSHQRPARLSIASAVTPKPAGSGDMLPRTVTKTVSAALGALRRIVRTTTLGSQSPSHVSESDGRDGNGASLAMLSAFRPSSPASLASSTREWPRGSSESVADTAEPHGKAPAASVPAYGGGIYAAASQRLRSGSANRFSPGAAGGPPPTVSSNVDMERSAVGVRDGSGPAASHRSVESSTFGHIRQPRSPQAWNRMPDVHARLAATLLAAAEVDAEAVAALQQVRKWTRPNTAAAGRPAAPKAAPPSLAQVVATRIVSPRSRDEVKRFIAHRQVLKAANQLAQRVNDLPSTADDAGMLSARSAGGEAVWVGGTYGGRRAPMRPETPGSAALQFVKRMLRPTVSGRAIPDSRKQPTATLQYLQGAAEPPVQYGVPAVLQADETQAVSTAAGPSAVLVSPTQPGLTLTQLVAVAANQLQASMRARSREGTVRAPGAGRPPTAAKRQGWGASPRRDPRLVMAGWVHPPHTRIGGPASANIPVLMSDIPRDRIAALLPALTALVVLDAVWEHPLLVSADASALATALDGYGTHDVANLLRIYVQQIDSKVVHGATSAYMSLRRTPHPPGEASLRPDTALQQTLAHVQPQSVQRRSVEMVELKAALRLLGAPVTTVPGEHENDAGISDQVLTDSGVVAVLTGKMRLPPSPPGLRPASAPAGRRMSSAAASAEETRELLQQRVDGARRHGFALLWADPAEATAMAAAATAGQPKIQVVEASDTAKLLRASTGIADVFGRRAYAMETLQKRRMWHASMRISWRLEQARTNKLVRLTMEDRVRLKRQQDVETRTPRASSAEGAARAVDRQTEAVQARPTTAGLTRRTSADQTATENDQRLHRLQVAARHHVLAAMRLHSERQACWLTIVKACLAGAHLTQIVRSARLQRVNIAAVLFIQKMWRGFRERIYAMKLRKAVMKLKQWMLKYRMKYLLRAKRRAAGLVVRFVREIVRSTSVTAVRAAARRLIFRVTRVQRCVRRFFLLQRARLQLLALWWRETQEQQRALVQWRTQQAAFTAGGKRPGSAGVRGAKAVSRDDSEAAAHSARRGEGAGGRRHSTAVPSLKLGAASAAVGPKSSGRGDSDASSRKATTAGAPPTARNRRISAPAGFMGIVKALKAQALASGEPPKESPRSASASGDDVRKPVSGARARAAMRAAVWTIAGVRSLTSNDGDPDEDSDLELDAVWMGLGLPTIAAATGAAGPAAAGLQRGLSASGGARMSASGLVSPAAMYGQSTAATIKSKKRDGFAGLPSGARRASIVLLKAALADDVIMSPAMAGMTISKPGSAVSPPSDASKQEAVDRVMSALQRERLLEVDVATRAAVLRTYLQKRLRDYARRVAKMRQLRKRELLERSRAAEQEAQERRARAAAARAARRASLTAAKAAAAAAAATASAPNPFLVRTFLDAPARPQPAEPTEPAAPSPEPERVFLTLTETDASAVVAPSRVSSVVDLMAIRDPPAETPAPDAAPSRIRELRDDARARLMNYDYDRHFPPLRLVTAAGSRAMAKLLVIARYKANAHLDLLGNVATAVSKQLETAAQQTAVQPPATDAAAASPAGPEVGTSRASQRSLIRAKSTSQSMRNVVGAGDAGSKAPAIATTAAISSVTSMKHVQEASTHGSAGSAVVPAAAAAPSQPPSIPSNAAVAPAPRPPASPRRRDAAPRKHAAPVVAVEASARMLAPVSGRPGSSSPTSPSAPAKRSAQARLSVGPEVAFHADNA